MAEQSILEKIRLKSYNARSEMGAVRDKVAPIMQSDITPSKRHDYIVPGLDMEDAYGRGQGHLSQIGRGLAKGVLTAGTTFVEGTLGFVYGGISAIGHRDFSKLHTNSVTEALDGINLALDNYMPNYYTLKERNAKWYSTDNWLTGNFWGESILKNAGFAVGAFYSGGVWTKALSTTAKGISAATRSVSALQRGAQATTGTRRANMLTKAIELENRLAPTAVPKNIAHINKELTKLNQSLSRTARLESLMPTYGRAILATGAEAGIEARHHQKIHLEAMIEKFIEKEGYAPQGEELKELEDISDKLGRNTYLANIGLLSITNMIQFPLLTGAYWKNLRATGRSSTRTVGKINVVNKDGKVVSRGAKRAPDTAKGETYASSGTVTAVGNQLSRNKAGRIVNRISPYAKSSFSLSQSGEAFSQIAIPNIWKDYFDAEYNGEDTSFYRSFVKGIQDTYNSKDGMSAMLSGGITGGMMRNFTAPLTGGRFFDTYRTHKNIKDTTNRFVSELNDNVLGNYMRDVNGSLKRAKVLEEQMEAALEAGDRLQFEDVKADQELNYLTARIQYGRGDLIHDEINVLLEKAKTDEGFAELQEAGYVGMETNRAEYTNNLLALKSRAKAVEKSIKMLTDRFGDQKNEDGTPKYHKKDIQRMSYLLNKVEDYDRRLPKLYEQFSDYNISVVDLVAAISNKDLTREQVTEMFEQKMQELADVGDHNNSTEDLQNLLHDVLELVERKQSAIQQYTLIRDKPELFGEESGLYETVFEDVEGTTKRAYQVSEYVVMPNGDIRRNGENIKIAEDGDAFNSIMEDLNRREEAGEDVSQQRAEVIEHDSQDGFAEYTVDRVVDKIINGEKLNNAEQIFYDANKDRVDQAKFEKEQAAKSDKEIFAEENEGKIFDLDGEKGRIEYDKTNDRLFHVGKTKQEISANDFLSGRVRPDEVISDTRNFTTKGVDERNLSVEQKNLVNQVYEFFREATTRRREAKEQLRQMERDLAHITYIANDKDFSKGYQDRYKKLAEEQEVISEIIKEVQEEIRHLDAMMAEYQRIIDNPAESVEVAVDLLAVEQDMLEDMNKESETFLGRLQDVYKGYGDVLRTLTTEVIQNINSHILGKGVGSTPLSDALKRALNLGDYKNSSDLMPQVDGFNIKYVVGRETQISNRIENLQELLSAAYAAKDDVAQQLSEKIGVTRDRIKRAEDTSQKQKEESKEQQKEDSKETPVPRVIDVIPSQVLTELVQRPDEITLEDIEQHTQDLTDKQKQEVLDYLNNDRNRLNELYKRSEKKNVDHVFRSSNLPPQGIKNKPIYKRFHDFLINREGFPKAVKERLREVYITANNQMQWTGQNLIDIYFSDELGNPYFKDKESSVDLHKGGILTVMAIQDADGSLHFVDKNGNKIKEVGGEALTDAQLNELVAWSKPDTDTTFENSDVERAYSSEGKVSERLQEERQLHIENRRFIFGHSSIVRPLTSRFEVSRGSYTRGTDIASEVAIANRYVSEQDLADTQVIYKVEKETNIGKLTFLPGEVLMATDETILPTVTRGLKQSEVDNVYNALLSMAEKPSTRVQLREYLRGVVNTSPKGTRNLVFGDDYLTATINGHLVELTTTDGIPNLYNNSDTIKTLLGELNTNVNVDLVNKNESFTEVTVDDTGSISGTKEYESYQNFLLDSTNPKIYAHTKEVVDKYTITNKDDAESMYDTGVQDKGAARISLIQTLVDSGKFSSDGKTIIPNVETVVAEGTGVLKSKSKKGRPDLKDFKNCKITKAEHGARTPITKGGKWELVKEFKGNSHARGGIDISIGDGKLSMTSKQGKFEAKHGVVITKNDIV